MPSRVTAARLPALVSPSELPGETRLNDELLSIGNEILALESRMFKVLSREFCGYLFASLVALCIDTALFLSLATVMHYLLAASVGFLTGALVAYGISVRWVFKRRRLGHAPKGEMVVFIFVGIAGLLVNIAVIHFMVEWAASNLFLAKMVAAGATFAFNFAVRKGLLF